MSDPDFRSLKVPGHERVEYRRGSVGYELLTLVERGMTAEREMHARELHHFEAEQAMTAALAALEPVNGLRPVIAAQVILRAAIAPHTHSTDSEFDTALTLTPEDGILSFEVDGVNEDEPHEHICKSVGDHFTCVCQCGTEKSKTDVWPHTNPENGGQDA